MPAICASRTTSDSCRSRGPSVKTRPQTIRLSGKDFGCAGAVKRHLGQIDRRNLGLAGGRRAVGLEVQDQDLVSVTASRSMRPLTRAPRPVPAARPPGPLPPGCRAQRRRRRRDRPAPPRFRSPAPRHPSTPLAADDSARRHVAAFVRRDLRQARQQGMHHQAAAEARCCRQRRESRRRHARGIGRPDQARQGGFGAAPARRPSRAGRIFLPRGFCWHSPVSSSTVPMVVISPSPRVTFVPSFSAAACASSIPGVRFDALLVLEAADIKPVAGAGERDIEAGGDARAGSPLRRPPWRA